MLVNRCIADYAITEGKCLLVCSNDGSGVQRLQQGFVKLTTAATYRHYYHHRVTAGHSQIRLHSVVTSC